MKHRRPLRWFAALPVVMLLSALTAAPAFADEPAPPPAAEEAAPAEDTPPILAELPAESNVVVLDENGESLPLSSQEAEEILWAGDPIWCPTGVAPKPNTGGCSPSFSYFGGLGDGQLLNWLDANDPAKAGTIWVAYDYNGLLEPGTEDDITINGSDFVNLPNFALTIQGGWSGTPGSTALDSAAPYSIFLGSLSIVNWHAAVTINDIQITTATTNPNTPVVNTAALYVQTDKGGITLNRVNIFNNITTGMKGAHLTTTGAPAGAPAPVTVNNSVFNNNFGSGLYIQADGAVKIKNVTSIYNGLNDANEEFGVYIDNWWDNLDQPVTFSGNNNILNNYGPGLKIDSFGVITLNNMNVSYNNDFSNNDQGDAYGAYIDNYHGATASNIVLTGVNNFNFNQLDGLTIYSNGNVLTNNLSANYNGLYYGNGALIDNCLGTPCAVTGKSVTMKGTNNFIGNGDFGLRLYSGGAVTINNLTANDNVDEDGAYINNCIYNGSVCTAAVAPVTLTGFATANNNGWGGGEDGLTIHSRGAITITNLTAQNNDYWGASIINDYDLTAHPNVTLNGTTSILNNGDTGLRIVSFGAVKANNLNASGNGWHGVYIDNLGYDGGPAASVLLVRQNVTLTGTNLFNNNGYYGLTILSVGTVSLNNVTANFNTDGGVYIRNNDDWNPNYGAQVFYAAPVTVNGYLTANNNANQEGIYIASAGKVTLKNVTANNNYLSGAEISSLGFAAPQGVTLTGVNTFLGASNGDGLYILTDGAVAVSNLTASGNDGNGAAIDNAILPWPNKFLGVKLTGTSVFQGNTFDGLQISTDGGITLGNAIADFNGDDGFDLSATKNISVMCVSAIFNTDYGFYASFGGVLTYKTIQPYLNGTNSNLLLPYLTTLGCP